MKTFSASLSEVNNMHPLVGAPIAGMLAVALTVLMGPTDLTRADAWGLFAAIGLGAGLGQWIRARAREDRANR